MLVSSTAKGGCGRYAQIGMMRDDNVVKGKVFIFIQYQTDSTSCYGYQPANPNTGYVPSGLGTYEVDKQAYNQYDMCWGSTCFYGSGMSWTPDHIENFNEIHNYTHNTYPPSAGDHAFGDGGHYENVYNVQYLLFQNPGWANANLTYSGQGSGLSADYQAVIKIFGYQWYIYDNRCSNLEPLAGR